MDETRTEVRFETPRRRVQLLGIAGPHRERERGVEEPLGPLCESVAKLERIKECDAAIWIGPAAVLLADAERGGQLGDPTFEEGHRRRTGTGRKMQRDVEVRLERLELAEPPW